MDNNTYPKLNVTPLLLGIGYHMLQFIRSKVTSIFIKVLFGILILSFAIWGIGDIFLGQERGETTVSVGDIDYNSDDITREFERTRKAMRLPPEYVALVKPQIIDSVINNLVNNGLFAAAGSDLNLLVSDSQIKNWIASSSAFKDQLGKFSPELFRRNLYNADLTEEEFFRSLKEDIKRNQLLSAINGAVTPNEEIIETLIHYRHEKRVANVVMISSDDIGLTRRATETELNKLYEETKSNYVAPEFRRATFIYLTPKQLAKEISIPKNILEEEYKNRKDEFTKPATREIRQFIFDTKLLADTARERAAKLNDTSLILKSLQASATKDKSSSLNAVTKNDFIAGKEQNAAFKTLVGNVSASVETPFGWKVFLIKSEIPEMTDPFQIASKTIQAELAQEKALDALFELTNAFEDTLASGATLEEAARSINVMAQKIAFTDDKGMGQKGEPLINLPPSGKFLSVLFSTLNGEQSNLIETNEGGYFLIRPDEILESRKLSFPEAKNLVEKIWKEEQVHKAAMIKAKKLESLTKAGVGLKNAAKNGGFKVETTKPFSRSGDELENSRYPSDFATVAFELSRGEINLVSGTKKIAVIELVNIDKAFVDKTNQEWQSIKREIESTMQQDYLEIALNSLKKNHNVTIDRNYINQLVSDPE